MEKFKPYVSLDVVKDAADAGVLDYIKVNAVAYLPKDSKIEISGEDKLSDMASERPLNMFYDGISEEFDYFGVEFTIKRENFGAFESKAKVSVKKVSDTSDPAQLLAVASAAVQGEKKDKEGTAVGYGEDDIA